MIISSNFDFSSTDLLSVIFLLYKFNLLLPPQLHHQIFVLKAAGRLDKTEAAHMTENPIYGMD